MSTKRLKNSWKLYLGQPKCLLTVGCIKYTILSLLSHKKGRITDTLTMSQINLKNVLLGKGSQTEKNTNCIIPFISNY
jgi:hypothetical protein